MTIKPGFFQQVFRAGLIAGLLDILAAILILAKGNAIGTLRYIASGAFGKAAFSGGAGMVAWGMLFHFTIACGFALAYFLLFPYFSQLNKNKWINGVCYGIVVWAAMRYVVLPLTLAPPPAFSWEGTVKNLLILSTCVGLPIAWLADRFFVSQTS